MNIKKKKEPRIYAGDKHYLNQVDVLNTSELVGQGSLTSYKDDNHNSTVIHFKVKNTDKEGLSKVLTLASLLTFQLIGWLLRKGTQSHSRSLASS